MLADVFGRLIHRGALRSHQTDSERTQANSWWGTSEVAPSWPLASTAASKDSSKAALASPSSLKVSGLLLLATAAGVEFPEHSISPPAPTMKPTVCLAVWSRCTNAIS